MWKRERWGHVEGIDSETWRGRQAVGHVVLLMCLTACKKTKKKANKQKTKKQKLNYIDQKIKFSVIVFLHHESQHVATCACS